MIYSKLLQFDHEERAHLQILDLEWGHLEAEAVLKQHFFLVELLGLAVRGVIRRPRLAVHIKQIEGLAQIYLNNNRHRVFIVQAWHRPHCILQSDRQLLIHAREAHQVYLPTDLHQAHVIGDLVILQPHPAPQHRILHLLQFLFTLILILVRTAQSRFKAHGEWAESVYHLKILLKLYALHLLRDKRLHGINI